MTEIKLYLQSLNKIMLHYTYKIIILAIFCLMINPAQSQSKASLSYKAKKSVRNQEYSKAINFYGQVLEIDSNNYKSFKGIADCYFIVEKFDSSKFYYEQAIRNSEPDKIDLDLYYTYAHTLRLTGNPTEALKNIDYFESKYKFNSNTEDLKNQIAVDKKYIDQQIIQSEHANSKVRVNNLGKSVNTEKSEFGCIYLDVDSSILYTGRYKDFRKEYEYMDGKFIENIYTYNFIEESVSIFNSTHQNTSHYSIVQKVSDSDSLIIYYQNVLWLNNPEKSTELTPLPLPLQGFYHQPSGVFNEKQNIFIFSASLTKQDDLDLYMSKKNESGIWSEPQIISSLSSDLDDDSPFLAEGDSILYFSSKGFNSAGDYDVYKSELTDGNWSDPVNLGYPLNSPGDDIFFITHNNQTFLSSNRQSGFGSMDIYKLSIPPTPTFDCSPFLNTELTATFDISEDVDPNSVGLVYNWLFDDGEKANGTNVTKTFLYPGEHLITVDILDTETGLMEEDQISQLINIENVPYVGFTYPQEVYLDSLSKFDAGISYIEGETIEEFHWKVNDSIIDTNPSELEHYFSEKGTHTVYLQLNTLKDNNYSSYCYQRQFEVIDIKDSKNNDPNNNGNGNDNINGDSLFADIYNSLDSMSSESSKINSMDSLFFEPIYFNFDKYFLTKKSKASLDALLLFLKKYPNANIIVQGHTDSYGSNAYNIQLSQKRIENSIKYLVANGLNPDRIYKTKAYGESRPAEPNVLENGKDNKRGRALNRRVEFNTFMFNE